MSKKIINKKADFIRKANIKHHHKYDYSKVKYINNSTKIIIICKIHGKFTQSPNKHLNGQGCKKCSINSSKNKRSLTTEEFISRAQKIHNNKYDYSKVKYINSKTSITIVCKEHGEFSQTPSHHLRGQGCTPCKNKTISKKLQMSKEKFIEKATDVHGDKYDYSNTKYKNNHTPIKIICNQHGIFEQIPSHHLKGHGCSKCAFETIKSKRRLSTKEFIKKANKIHNNTYDYSKTKYINTSTKIIIICEEHGQFLKAPSKHLAGQGCPKCSKVSANNKTKLSMEEFIKRAQSVHGNKYDYSNVEYVNIDTKVIIICKKHGEFHQTPYSHINNSNGCPKCPIIKKKLKKCQNKIEVFDTDSFINKANRIHKKIYDYSKTVYKSQNVSVKIICSTHGIFKQTPTTHLRGSGCPKCGIINGSAKRSLSLNQFIKTSNKTHNNKYDYSKTRYVNNHTKVTIICKDHGEFTQTPGQHKIGQGCPKCANIKYAESRKMNIEDFKQKANEIHNNKYDYSNIKYINSKTTVEVICPDHGFFYQTPNAHLSGKGCRMCSVINNAGIKKKSFNDFVDAAKNIHGNKYDYSKVKYNNNKTKVIIICNKHGEFEQRPDSHIGLMQGCPSCSKITKEEFIDRANKIHSHKYDYSKISYDNCDPKIIIICPTHGDFKQNKYSHLNGSGCPKCSIVGYSKRAIKWLDYVSAINNIFICHAKNHGEYIIPNTKYKADGFCKETNTVYEFNGCLYHGCPICYDPNEDNPITHKSNNDLYEKTIKKEKTLRTLGYNLVVIWEHEWINFTKNILKLSIHELTKLIYNNIATYTKYQKISKYLSNNNINIEHLQNNEKREFNKQVIKLIKIILFNETSYNDLLFLIYQYTKSNV